jgi:ketosteroid isomerase-like protein
MKTCPRCKTQYTDDSLRFCLQDGTPLGPAAQAGEPTVALGGVDAPSTETKWRDQSQITQVLPPKGTRSGPGIIAAAAIGAGAFVLLAAIAGVAAWFFLTDRPPGPGQNENLVRINANVPGGNNTPANEPAPKTPVPSKGTNVDPARSPTPVPAADRELEKRTVSMEIYGWKEDTERGSLNAQIARYAPSVNYYQRTGANPEFIRRDKERAFRMYDSISIDISNMQIDIAPSGDTATAVFDKEWDFDGSRRSRGKVRQQLQFRKFSGRWLITGERDLSVYYTN